MARIHFGSPEGSFSVGCISFRYLLWYLSHSSVNRPYHSWVQPSCSCASIRFVYSSGVSMILESAMESGSMAKSIPWYSILCSWGSTLCLLKVCHISLSRLARVLVLAEHMRKWVSGYISLLHCVHLSQGA